MRNLEHKTPRRFRFSTSRALSLRVEIKAAATAKVSAFYRSVARVVRFSPWIFVHDPDDGTYSSAAVEPFRHHPFALSLSLFLSLPVPSTLALPPSSLLPSEEEAADNAGARGMEDATRRTGGGRNRDDAVG